MKEIYIIRDEDYLEHHGVKGQRWGIRRYQNEDGSLTDIGKKRYSGVAGKSNKDIDKYQSDTSSGKNFWKGFFVGFKGEQNRRVYDLARQNGEGRVKSLLRSSFDLGAGTPITLGAAVTSTIVANKINKNSTSFKGKIVADLVSFGITTVGRIIKAGISTGVRNKGKAASLQEKSLIKKYYNDKDSNKRGN